MNQRVAIVNYATGNLRSIWSALNRVGSAADVVSDPEGVRAADKIILPGVGNFTRAMSALRGSALAEALHDAVLRRQVPVLGICLGMEIMGAASEEGRSEGLGWLPSNVVRFRSDATGRRKVPYIGWNKVSRRRSSSLLRRLDSDAEFYFLHSYHLEMFDDAAVVGETTYSRTFPSVVERDNIFGVQFHPERSHRWGERLLKNFLEV